jgi:hypothetical protein
MLITAYPDIVRREGLAVSVVHGFESRSHGEYQRNPPAIVWHHDASPPGPSPGVLGWMVDNWNSASANIWVDYNGRWWFVGAGISYHAGATLPGMPTNQTAIGIETDYTVGETIPWNLYDSLRRGTAAIMRATGQPASDLHFHKTICKPKGRKSDPWGLDLGAERAALSRLIAGGNPPLPLPDPNAPGGPGGADPADWIEELMASVTEEQKALLLAGAQASVDIRTLLVEHGNLKALMDRTYVIEDHAKNRLLKTDRFNEVLTDVVNRLYVIQDHIDNPENIPPKG